MQIIEEFSYRDLKLKAYIVYFDTVGYRVICDIRGGLNDNPIDYSLWNPDLSGIAYDYPFRVPYYVQQLTRRAYKRLKMAYPLVR